MFSNNKIVEIDENHRVVINLWYSFDSDNDERTFRCNVERKHYFLYLFPYWERDYSGWIRYNFGNPEKNKPLDNKINDFYQEYLKYMREKENKKKQLDKYFDYET